MAFGLIDPARLEGEALQRWYRRSPADLEYEREAGEAQRYVQITAPMRPASLALAAEANSRTGSDRWPGAFGYGQRQLTAPAPQRGAFGHEEAQRQRVQIAANDHVCRSCHWGGVPPIPPRGLTSFRDVPTLPPSKPPERDRKQCEIQDARDRETCGRQPNAAAKAVCNESATRRYSHCLLTGEVDYPNLFTHPSAPRR